MATPQSTNFSENFESSSALGAQAYVPIDCDLMDNLELYAMHKVHVRALIRDEKNARQEIRGNVADVTTRDHADFVVFEDGRSVRADRIIEIEKRDR